MNKETNLMHSLSQSENKIEIFKALTLAFDRADYPEISRIKPIAEDIIERYPMLDAETILRAINWGAYGRYGITYKITTQVISFWIISYCKDMCIPFSKIETHEEALKRKQNEASNY